MVKKNQLVNTINCSLIFVSISFKYQSYLSFHNFTIILVWYMYRNKMHQVGDLGVSLIVFVLISFPPSHLQLTKTNY